MSPELWQRIEGGVVAASTLVAGPYALGVAWWWPLALFLAFDVSMVGYFAGARIGAFVYNAAHSYIGPALLVGTLMLVGGSTWIAVVAVAWVFHVGVDRALGYGLKHDDAFEHTHLGLIGGAARARRIAGE
jgi:hypothetical protein